MNISYNWLKEYVDTQLSPKDLADALTSIGLEAGTIEEIESIKGGLEGLVVGEVLSCENHPDSDHLHLTTVNVGEGNPLQIVCGAPNVAQGQKVIVALVGTKLYSGDEVFTIKKSKIRGVESFGMICAEDEIGIGTSHEGIIVLPAAAPVGMLAKEYYQVQSDYIIEVDITPNRSDAVSHYGVARDLAAYLKQNGQTTALHKPDVSAFALHRSEGGVPVRVENAEACPRYSGVTIRDIKVAESPDWLKNKLLLIGLRPINNLVDITNFVLHELGQPLHAFDADKIAGGEVIVRTLDEGTEFVTLDGEIRKLNERDLMICDAQGGMCIGGVFGGLNSGVTEGTTNVFLESAYFHPTWIRKTARRHGLHTDASFRFERGCDPNQTLYALQRAALLIVELAGGEICGPVQDIYPTPIAPKQVSLAYKKVNSLIGKDLTPEEVKNILSYLEIEVIAESEGVLELKVPTYRVDVERDVDVIEDILRIYGFNQVEVGDTLKTSLSYQTDTDKSVNLQELVSEQLTGLGFNEILNNSLTAVSYYESQSVYPVSSSVKVLNSLSNDLGVMRQTLLFGGLESIAYNVNRKNADLKLYEFGNCYFYDANRKKEGAILNEYSEELHLGLWLTGKHVQNTWLQADEDNSFFHLKAYVESVFSRIGISEKKIVYSQYSNELYAAALQIQTMSGRVLGTMGLVSKKTAKQFDLQAPIYYAYLHWDNLLKETKKHQVRFSEISKYPSVDRDFALLLDASVSFDDIVKVAAGTEKKYLKEITLFDVYEGKNLPEGKKSYAVSFVLQDTEKTLQDKQIDAIMKSIQTNLEKKLGAQLR